jgi:hypothetical protein
MIYTTKLFKNIIFILVLGAAAFLNWQFPFYNWFGDTPIVRFVWLGLFFIILDGIIEIILGSFKQLRLMGEAISFSNDLKKIANGFKVTFKVKLPNNLRADAVVIGSSGVWLIMIKDNKGQVSFNGDELIQDETILKGLLTHTLEKAYSLAGLLKQGLNRDFVVTPIIAFSSPGLDLGQTPRVVRGVRLAARHETVSLIENTDIQLIDEKTIEDIYKFLKK